MIGLKKCLLFGSVLSLGASMIGSGYAQEEMQGRMEEKLPTHVTHEVGERIGFMGLNGGVSNPIGKIGSTAEMAIVAGAQPETGVGYGGELSSTRLDDQDKTMRTTLLAQAAYKFGGDTPVVRNTYMSIGAGPSIVKTQVKFAVSPQVGFDIPLTNKVHDTVSLGLNAKYIGVTNSPDAYVGSAAVKYWY